MHNKTSHIFKSWFSSDSIDQLYKMIPVIYCLTILYYKQCTWVYPFLTTLHAPLLRPVSAAFWDEACSCAGLFS